MSIVTSDAVIATGTVISVRGAVVEVQFNGAALPPINTALVVGDADYALARRAREALARFKDLQDIILSGAEELSVGDRQLVPRARRFLSQPFVVTEAFAGARGCSVKKADTLDGCRAILGGETDDWAESSLYMVGTLADARARAAAVVQAS